MERRAFIVGGLGVLAGPLAATAQPPIRIGVSLGQTGAYAALAQNRLRGTSLCIKHANEKGGVLGRTLQLVVEDDQSKTANAVRIYEQLISQERVDLILSPIGAPLVDAVATVAEKYRMPMVAPGGGSTSIFKKGRRFLFQVLSPSEAWLEGFVELAVRHGLKTIALINEGTLFPRTVVDGASEFAKKRGLQVVFAEAYPRGTTGCAPLRIRST
jgi:branched-chain amino acid transport system substrate-binding protein